MIEVPEYPPADQSQSAGKDAIMIKAEEIQQYGKEQFETAVASAGTFQSGVQAIATTVGDYTKKSFEDGNAFVEKLAGVKSLEKAIEAQTEYAKSAHEAFRRRVAEGRRTLCRSRQAGVQAVRRPRRQDDAVALMSRTFGN